MSTNQIRIFLASDSTVQTYQEENQGGWGEFLHSYFSSNVQIFNHAIGGRSSKTFIEEGRLAAIAELMQAGDYLLIQMGHNDATKSRPERYTEPFTTYKDYLRRYVTEARIQKAVPIFITPVARLHYENGVFMNDFPDYCKAMKEVAVEENVIIIDLMEKSLNYLEVIGYEEAYTLYMAFVIETDFTHFTKKGADRMARLVAEEIGNSIEPLSPYIRIGEFSIDENVANKGT